jgi:hypothetical protein
MSGANPDHECCRSRGGVAVFDANAGKLLWQASSIHEPLHELGKNSEGKQLWCPPGASVWKTPTIDAKRKRIYVGAGNYGPVAAEAANSILALNLSDGKVGLEPSGITERFVHGWLLAPTIQQAAIVRKNPGWIGIPVQIQLPRADPWAAGLRGKRARNGTAQKRNLRSPHYSSPGAFHCKSIKPRSRPGPNCLGRPIWAYGLAAESSPC